MISRFYKTWGMTFVWTEGYIIWLLYDNKQNEKTSDSILKRRFGFDFNKQTNKILCSSPLSPIIENQASEDCLFKTVFKKPTINIALLPLFQV